MSKRNMNVTNLLDEPQNVLPPVIQFVRSKGKLIEKRTKAGRLVKDKSTGKPVMVRSKGDPRGILVADRIDGEVRIGWSFANRKLDPFNKNIGMKIAIGRLTMPSAINRIPHQVISDIKNSFAERAATYFKVPVAAIIG